MLILGADIVRAVASGGLPEAKAVFSAAGVIFFGARLQHRDQKATGISCRDNYLGNAMAAMIAPAR